MKFNRKIFFDQFRNRIDSTIEQEQVDALEFLLGKIEKDPFWKFIPQIAYALATAFHETAGSFQPVVEGYYLGDKNAPNYYAGNTERVKRFHRSLRYYPYFGRGLVQLTWEANYKKAGNILGLDMVKHPELALEPEGSYKVLTYGMHQGWFTGKKLDDYIKDNKKDYEGARKIINGTDKAGLIAGYARSFEKILSAAKESDNTTSMTDPEINEIFDPIIVAGPSMPEPSPEPRTDPPADPSPADPSPTFDVPPAGEQDPAQQSGKDNVVIEKPVPKTLWEYIKYKFGALTGGGVTYTTAVTQAQEVQALGLPATFTLYALVTGIVVAVALVAIWVVSWWRTEKQQERTTDRLINANSTDENIIHFATKEELEAWKKWGAIIVRRESELET